MPLSDIVWNALQRFYHSAIKYLRRLVRPERRPILDVAEGLLEKHGETIRKYVCRPPPVPDISFSLSENLKVPAGTSGTRISLNKKYFERNPDDHGAIVHEIAHAIQRATKYEGDFVWQIEGIADFIRYRLGYGWLERGDPRQSYKAAASFFNWLYDKYPNIFNEAVNHVNDGLEFEKLDDYLDLYRK